MVGVVTKVHTENGTVDAADIDADLRSEWAERLANKIEEIDGVQEAVVSSLSVFSENQVGSIELVVDSTADEYPSAIELSINPRSFSPRLRSVCDEYAPLSSFEVSYTPTAIDADRGLYDSDYYIVDIYFY